MATGQAGGMFGPSVEELQQQQRAGTDAYARDLATMDPYARANYAIGSAAGGIANTVGGMMGYQDPAQARAKKIQDILQNQDQTTYEGMVKIAKDLNSQGLSNEAAMAMGKARELQASELAVKKEDRAQQELEEVKKARVLADAEAKKEALAAKIQMLKDTLESRSQSASEANQTRLMIAQGNQQMRLLIAQLAAAGKTAKTGSDLTVGEKAADRKFGTTYADYQAGGGSAEVEANLQSLSQVQAELEAPGNDYTGASKAMLPDSVRAFTNEKAVAAKNNVERAVQNSLKVILGAQFTQKEGENLLARTYNPKLSPATNAKNVKNLIDKLRTAAQTKEDAARYFEENGTLKGWKGRVPQLSDFSNESTGSAAPTPTAIFAVNPSTGMRITSTDNGKTWKPAGAQ